MMRASRSSAGGRSTTPAGRTAASGIAPRPNSPPSCSLRTARNLLPPRIGHNNWIQNGGQVTWKRKCGGVPRNSFVIVKLNESAAGVTPGSVRPCLLLARVSETATTPVAADIQSTIFQIHKVQAKIDPLTNAELQWG